MKRCDRTLDAFSEVMSEYQIKAVIKERGWTQAQIAEYWGMSRTWISALVKNKNGSRTVRDDCAFMGLPRR